MTKIPSTSQASFIKGLWFIFRDGDREIAAHGSTLGQERIFVNGKLVSQKRSLSKKSTHQFIFEGNMYEIMFVMPKTSITEMECSLTKDNICIEIFKAHYNYPSKIKIFFNIIVGLLFGALLGILNGLLSILLKIPSFVLLTPILGGSLFMYFKKLDAKALIIIKKINV
jgi:hypothetical protein